MKKSGENVRLAYDSVMRCVLEFKSSGKWLYVVCTLALSTVFVVKYAHPKGMH